MVVDSDELDEDAGKLAGPVEHLNQVEGPVEGGYELAGSDNTDDGWLIM